MSMKNKGTLLRVKFFDNQEEKPFIGVKTIEESLRRFKIFLGKCTDKWEYATVYSNGTLYCYFHKNKGVEELDKQQYIKEFKQSQINLYIVYKFEYKKRTGNNSGKSIFNSSIEDVKSLFNSDVEKILVYQNNQIISTYQDGKFI